ncbi:MAG: type II toxin-antitoxin system RelB/DinJ family antitoxin [Bacilli bacterium]|nr:type II toxin-antitoxin system RelB/DinJ family antitoxin [Bacilli bacterium]
MANINVRIDNKIKEKAEAVFASLGITPTAAISLFYNQVIRTNSIPFKLKADIPNQKTLLALNEVKKMEKNPEKFKGYNSVESMMDDLRK